MSELADRIRSQATTPARPGQHDQLMAIANEVAELDLAHSREIDQARADERARIAAELNPSHWRAVANAPIRDDYERGRVHAEDDLWRKLGENGGT